MGALSGKVAKVKITAITPTSSTGETFTKLSTGKYQITDYTKRHWDRQTTGAPTVYVNTTARTADEYTVDPVNGIIQFSPTSLTTGAVPVTADIHYVTASYLTQARSWSAELDTPMHDVTAFNTSTGSKTWRSYTPGLMGGTVTLGRLVSTGSTANGYPVEFYDRLNLNQDLVVELHMQDFEHLAGYGWIEQDTFNVPIDEQETEDITIRLDGPLYYSTSS